MQGIYGDTFTAVVPMGHQPLHVDIRRHSHYRGTYGGTLTTGGPTGQIDHKGIDGGRFTTGGPAGVPPRAKLGPTGAVHPLQGGLPRLSLDRIDYWTANDRQRLDRDDGKWSTISKVDEETENPINVEGELKAVWTRQILKQLHKKHPHTKTDVVAILGGGHLG